MSWALLSWFSTYVVMLSSETSVHMRTTWRYIPQYGSIHGLSVSQQLSCFIWEVNDKGKYMLPSKLIVVEVSVLLVLQLSWMGFCKRNWYCYSSEWDRLSQETNLSCAQLLGIYFSFTSTSLCAECSLLGRYNQQVDSWRRGKSEPARNVACRFCWSQRKICFRCGIQINTFLLNSDKAGSKGSSAFITTHTDVNYWNVNIKLQNLNFPCKDISEANSLGCLS
jgi:hypothetical protein